MYFLKTLIIMFKMDMEESRVTKRAVDTTIMDDFRKLDADITVLLDIHDQDD